jgi:hypothetical protein
MRLLILVILIFSVVLLSSCNNNGSTVVDVNFYLLVKNADGKNLLDSATTGYYAQDSIRLYRLEIFI